MKYDIRKIQFMTTDTPQLNEHKQNCDSASAESKPACVMTSDSNFAKDKAEYSPMHTGKFEISPINQEQRKL